MKVAKRTAIALCPECEQEINLGTTSKMGQKVVCPECEANLQVVSLAPLALSWDVSDFEDSWESDDDW